MTEHFVSRISQWVRRQQFSPGALGVFVSPFFLARRALHHEITRLAGQIDGAILDVGCGRKPYRPLFSCKDYVGLEIDTPVARQMGFADVYYDGTRFPFQDAAFDAVLCNQVLEHVFNPTEFLGEIARVLRPGGRLLLTVPFVWDEHEQPYDYARYSSFGLTHLLEKNQFRVVSLCKTLPTFALIGQLINCYLYKRLWTKSALVNVAIAIFPMSLVSIIFAVLGKLLPQNADFYLDNVVLAERT